MGRDRTDFGRRLFEAREHAGLTQAQVRKALGVSQGTLSGLEHRAAGSSLTVRFAELYQVDAMWLATGEGTPRGRSENQDNKDQGMSARKSEEAWPCDTYITPERWAALNPQQRAVVEWAAYEALQRVESAHPASTSRKRAAQ